MKPWPIMVHRKEITSERKRCMNSAPTESFPLTLMLSKPRFSPAFFVPARALFIQAHVRQATLSRPPWRSAAHGELLLRPANPLFPFSDSIAELDI